MNRVRRYGTFALVALLTLTVLASPAIAAGDDSVVTTDSMNDSMEEDSMGENSMQDESMNDTESMDDGETMAGDDSMNDTESGTDTSADGPGFTAALALVALVGSTLLLARRSA